MRIATIDIGTNTVLALHAQTGSDGRRTLRAISDDMDIVRLGEGLDASGVLADAAIGRAIAVLTRHARRLRTDERSFGKIACRAVATEAVRKAGNGDEFLARAREVLGFDVEVIGGEREAQLVWLASSRSLPRAPGGRRTVLDIGGGSTELMIGSDTAPMPEAVLSMPIGAVRLHERIVQHDPPSDEETASLIATIDAALDHAPRPDGDLVGVAGTVTSLAAMHLGLATWDPERVHGYRLKRDAVEALVARLARLPIEERKRLPGLDPKRADVIYAGGMILSRVLARAATDELIVSDRGVRWGLAYELAEAEG